MKGKIEALQGRKSSAPAGKTKVPGEKYPDTLATHGEIVSRHWRRKIDLRRKLVRLSARSRAWGAGRVLWAVNCKEIKKPMQIWVLYGRASITSKNPSRWEPKQAKSSRTAGGLVISEQLVYELSLLAKRGQESVWTNVFVCGMCVCVCVLCVVCMCVCVCACVCVCVCVCVLCVVCVCVCVCVFVSVRKIDLRRKLVRLSARSRAWGAGRVYVSG